MDADRLLKLAELLERPLPAGLAFDLATFDEDDGRGCRVCAAGLAARDDWFNARGLEAVACVLRGPQRVREERVPAYDGLYGYEALEAFFGLPRRHVDYLFNPRSYRGLPPHPHEVADRLRLFVAERRPAVAAAGS